MSRARRAALRGCSVIAALPVLAGCGQIRGEQVENGFLTVGQEPTVLAFTDEVAVDNPLMDFDIVEVSADAAEPAIFQFLAADAFDRSPVLGEDLFSARPMMISFFTPTCPICLDEGPKLARSAELNPDIDHVIVHSGGDPEQYQAFVAEAGLDSANITHITDAGSPLWIHFGVLATPTYVLIDEDGRSVRSTGALMDHGLARASERLTDLDT